MLFRSAAPLPQPQAVVEASITPLPLGAPLNQDDLEISGLAWKGDSLVILPQYPSRYAPEGHYQLYALSREEIERARTADAPEPLQPTPIPIQTLGISDQVPDYEGCEAITFVNGRVYVLVEARREDGMHGFLLTGDASVLDPLRIDVGTPHEIPAQAPLANMAYEALTMWKDTVLTFYEANGAHVNPTPAAHKFTQVAEPVGAVPFPTLEYRLTDATAVDDEGRFWVTNYFYPGEQEILEPAPDSLRLRHGTGPTHGASDIVERLVEYQYQGTRVVRTDTPPLWLKLDGTSGRNWEGVARLGDGFLVATDQYPHSMLAYVE